MSVRDIRLLLHSGEEGKHNPLKSFTLQLPFGKEVNIQIFEFHLLVIISSKSYLLSQSYTKVIPNSYTYYQLKFFNLNEGQSSKIHVYLAKTLYCYIFNFYVLSERC